MPRLKRKSLDQIRKMGALRARSARDEIKRKAEELRKENENNGTSTKQDETANESTTTQKKYISVRSDRNLPTNSGESNNSFKSCCQDSNVPKLKFPRSCIESSTDGKFVINANEVANWFKVKKKADLAKKTELKPHKPIHLIEKNTLNENSTLSKNSNLFSVNEDTPCQAHLFYRTTHSPEALQSSPLKRKLSHFLSESVTRKPEASAGPTSGSYVNLDKDVFLGILELAARVGKSQTSDSEFLDGKVAANVDEIAEWAKKKKKQDDAKNKEPQVQNKLLKLVEKDTLNEKKKQDAVKNKELQLQKKPSKLVEKDTLNENSTSLYSDNLSCGKNENVFVNEQTPCEACPPKGLNSPKALLSSTLKTTLSHFVSDSLTRKPEGSTGPTSGSHINLDKHALLGTLVQVGRVGKSGAADPELLDGKVSVNVDKVANWFEKKKIEDTANNNDLKLQNKPLRLVRKDNLNENSTSDSHNLFSGNNNNVFVNEHTPLVVSPSKTIYSPKAVELSPLHREASHFLSDSVPGKLEASTAPTNVSTIDLSKDELLRLAERVKKTGSADSEFYISRSKSVYVCVICSSVYTNYRQMKHHKMKLHKRGAQLLNLQSQIDQLKSERHPHPKHVPHATKTAYSSSG